MPVNENDLELLSSYVDGELPVTECEGLWRRLAAERDLATELDHLREDMSTRAMSWSSFEPDDGAVARLQQQVMRSARREDIFSTLRRFGSVASSVAAILLFGFTVGWMGRGNAMAPNTALRPGVSSTPIADVQNTPGPDGKGTLATFYDEKGNIVARRSFGSSDDEQQFIRDLITAQNPQQQNPQQGTRDAYMVPAGNRF
jgi:hypothetical protein